MARRPGGRAAWREPARAAARAGTAGRSLRIRPLTRARRGDNPPLVLSVCLRTAWTNAFAKLQPLDVERASAEEYIDDTTVVWPWAAAASGPGGPRDQGGR